MKVELPEKKDVFWILNLEGSGTPLTKYLALRDYEEGLRKRRFKTKASYAVREKNVSVKDLL